MTAIKVIKRTILEDPEVAELVQIRDEWTEARKDLVTDGLSGVCTISGCRTMPFVSLRTASGRRPLCLRHFEKLREETV
jgi:hypothetical protein